MTRAEHLRWAKDRAFTSLTSDLGKHPDTTGHPGIELMTMLAMSGDFDRPGRLREYIEGFR